MTDPVDIFTGLNNPLPNILGQLEGINRQVNFFTKSPEPLDGTGLSPFVGIAAVRRNYKPFIIGFIPPDNPINYVPIKSAEIEISKIPPYGSTLNGKTPTLKYKPQLKNIGLVGKKIERVPVAELRQSIIDSYTRLTGVAPSEIFIRNAMAQTYVEAGMVQSPKGDYVAAPCFQLAGIHCGKPGQYTYRTNPDGSYKFNTQGKLKVAVYADETSPPVPPGGGGYYLDTDYNPVKGGGSLPYQTYFRAYSSIDEATEHYVSQIVGKWPGTTTAATEEEFVNALLDTSNGGPYFTAPPDYYLKGIRTRGSQYDAQKAAGAFGNQDTGLSIEEYNNQVEAQTKDFEQNPKRLMAYGSGNPIPDQSKDPLGDALGRNLVQIDDRRVQIVNSQVNALRDQIERIQSIPPLLLLVNPSEFTKNYEHAVDNSVKARSGHIVHLWMERPFTIDCQGVTAGQYVVDASGHGGLTTAYRVYSLSYANLSSLVSVYKNNGRIFSGDEAGSDNRGVNLLNFTVYIYYDEHLYLGSFDDLSVNDEETKVHNMSYSFKFTVRYEVSLDLTTTTLREADARTAMNNLVIPSDPNYAVADGVPAKAG